MLLSFSTQYPQSRILLKMDPVVAAKSPFPNVAAVINLNLTEKTTIVSNLKMHFTTSSPGTLWRTGPLHSRLLKFSPVLRKCFFAILIETTVKILCRYATL